MVDMTTYSRYLVPKPVEHPWIDPEDVPSLDDEDTPEPEDAEDLPIFGSY